jgi:magnesium transporter
MLDTLPPSVTKALRCDVPSRTFRHLTAVDQIGAAVEDPSTLLWLDLTHPTEDELSRLAERFHLHPLAVEDALHGHQRPKIEEYEGFFFLVFYAATAVKKAPPRVETAELRMFVGTTYLITIHDAPVAELDEAERRWTHAAPQVEEGIAALLYVLLDTVVDHYFPVVDELVEQAEGLEERIYAGQTRDRQFTYELLSLKRCLLDLRRLIGPERDVLNVLTNRDSPVFGEHTLIYFRDIYDHVARLADTLDLYRDQLSTTMDANLAVVSNDLNKVMRTLTAWSIILMSAAVITGIYGMNFDFMPELHWRFGYPLILGLIALVGFLLWRFFKHLRWF